MFEVESSAIKSLGYDPEKERLVVQFPRGVTWAYVEVPAKEYCRLLAAESIGSYFSRHIRNTYAGVKVKEISDEASSADEV